jgi:hypothetical protein
VRLVPGPVPAPVAARALSFCFLCVRVFRVAGELAASTSASASSSSLSSFPTSVPSSAPSSSASSISSSSSAALARSGDTILGVSTSTWSLVDRVPRVVARVGLARRPRDGAGEDRGSNVKGKSQSASPNKAVIEKKASLSIPSVSATVLPRRDSGCPDVAGDEDRSAASRLENINSPNSSSGNSNGQYSDSSDPSAIIESSCIDNDISAMYLCSEIVFEENRPSRPAQGGCKASPASSKSLGYGYVLHSQAHILDFSYILKWPTSESACACLFSTASKSV